MGPALVCGGCGLPDGSLAIPAQPVTKRKRRGAAQRSADFMEQRRVRQGTNVLEIGLNCDVIDYLAHAFGALPQFRGSPPKVLVLEGPRQMNGSETCRHADLCPRATGSEARRMPSYGSRKPGNSRGFNPNRVAMTGKEFPARWSFRLLPKLTTWAGESAFSAPLTPCRRPTSLPAWSDQALGRRI